MADKKEARYQRLLIQITGLMVKSSNPASRMATIIAVLHHKISYFYWTGFYLLDNGELMVGPYQGSLACLKLEKNKGVCWAGINFEKSVIVPDVHQFPGHIACSDLSKSEIVVPLHNNKGVIVGVLDVDSRELDSFNETDQYYLEKIVELIYQQ